ncbi:sigma-54-dependent Fis family transcriptional regulator [Virgibacillus phasianinus]|uniref:Sigma-54-dependent Fis family transcriptional regulator n=2 Tax=Virgibacillus phasianinus TaxID=2017483 RepID=A0A220U896_9BACI|nr:sigma-54-dependent Fis family transcriptional regulator [Virgibacillus phasianinus]
MSANYCRFLGVTESDATGAHVEMIIENTRMHIVAKTGKDEISDLQLVRGSYVVANRIPIFDNNEVVGAIGTVIFSDLEKWKKMNVHIKNLLTELNFYQQEWNKTNGVNYSLQDLVGRSVKILELKDRVLKLASGDISVLIRGESGTGKELIAHSIHQLSERSRKQFVKVNCGSIPEHLLESELFGYVEGAFTGAKKGGKMGKFKFADGGTIFLDEIGDMPDYMQVKLLRVLQEKEIEPVGALQSEKVDVRIITATNMPIEKMIELSEFREDLFYRINAAQLVLPPLRERREDLSILAYHFLKKITTRMGKRINLIDEDAMALINHYHWPGNIRELENAIEVAVHLSEGDTIDIHSLPSYLTTSHDNTENKPLKELMDDTEKSIIERELKKHHYDKLKVAEVLGIGKSSLYAKIKKYYISC